MQRSLKMECRDWSSSAREVGGATVDFSTLWIPHISAIQRFETFRKCLYSFALLSVSLDVLILERPQKLRTHETIDVLIPN